MPLRPLKYAHHKPSGQARVRINGKSHYLGVYDSPKLHEQYDKLVAKWLSGEVNADRDAITVSRLAIMYVDHSRVYYIKDGVQTSEIYAVQAALSPTRQYNASSFVASCFTQGDKDDSLRSAFTVTQTDGYSGEDL